jgi:MerR family transcriptional regulator, light-induced transcriptional regulator
LAIMTLTDSLDLSASARMRSGTAARLAGLPVTTLRVWERRYGVVAAPKTDTGQRLYSGLDVQRLRLLKRLTDCGHAIGSVAGLSVEALEALMVEESSLKLTATALETSAPSPSTAPRSDSLRVWVVGRGAAQKLESLATCELAAVHDDLNAAEAASARASATDGFQPPDVLLVHLASLLVAEVDRVTALALQLGSPCLVVLYAFGRESLADTLRSAGATVRRDLMGARELCNLVSFVASQKRRASAMDVAFTSSTGAAVQAAVPARQFDDASLAYLMNISTNVACECPHHVAEIVMQLVSFERYSQDCLSRSPADADLHAHLTDVAAAARSGFERALQRVIAAEGIVLPERVKAAL